MRSTVTASMLLLASGLMFIGCTRDSTITGVRLGPSLSIQSSAAVVPAFVCAVILDGKWTVPAGAEVVVDQGWEARNRGLVQAFLNAQSTTLAVNGGSAVDVSDRWGPIEHLPTAGVYRAAVTLPTGIVLATGESMTFNLKLPLSHRVLDGFTLEDGASHKPLFFGPGLAFEFACTVTAQ